MFSTPVLSLVAGLGLVFSANATQCSARANEFDFVRTVGVRIGKDKGLIFATDHCRWRHSWYRISHSPE